ncbi:hypothetical protein KI387_018649, partial [Taxus chinensis]
RGRGEEGAPSVPTTQIVSMPSTSTNSSTYVWRKNSLVKEKMPKVEAPKQPTTMEESQEEEEKEESLDQKTPLRKKQRVDEEADLEVTDSLEKYLGEGQDESEGGGDEEEDIEKDKEPLEPHIFS